MSNEDQIREAAYFVWLNNGCPENVEIDCWLEAEADARTTEEVCPCCGQSPCTCGPECECRKEGGDCCCKEKKAAKKAPAKKAAAKKAAEPKAEKKAPAKKVAAKK